MRRSLLFLVLLSIGCGTAAGVPDGEPQEPPPTTPPPPTARPTGSAPTPAQAPAVGCQPQTFVAGAPGLTVDYQSLVLDGASLAFVEAITWDPSTRTSDGQWLTSVDTKTGATKRHIAHFDGGPQAIALDASAFYVAVWGSATLTGKGTGWLARVDRTSGETTTLSTGLSLSWSLAGFDDTLLFSNRADDDNTIELRTVPKAGGVSTPIGAGLAEGAKILTDDAGGVAWIELTGPDGTQRLVYRANGITTELARGNLVTTALARQGDTFYFADDTGVFSVSRTGGAPSVVVVAPRVGEVFADAHAIAWLQGPSYAGDLAVNDDAVLMSTPTTGGVSTRLAAVHSPHDLVADDGWLYWVDNQSEIHRVCRPF